MGRVLSLTILAALLGSMGVALAAYGEASSWRELERSFPASYQSGDVSSIITDVRDRCASSYPGTFSAGRGSNGVSAQVTSTCRANRTCDGSIRVQGASAIRFSIGCR